MDATTPKAKAKERKGAAMKPAPKPRRAKIELAKLRRHYEGTETQLRLKIDENLAARYAYEMRRGDQFPAIAVVPAGGGTYYLADGWHRVAAAERLSEQDRRRSATIAADVYPCPDDVKPIEYAVELALGANLAHGLQLTRGDQIRRAMIALKLPKYQGLSDQALEREIGASRMTISRARARLLERGELVEWHTGEPLPPFVPEAYARVHRKGTRGHPLCWDLSLREEVFAFLGQLDAFAPREWSYHFDGEGEFDGADAEAEKAKQAAEAVRAGVSLQADDHDDDAPDHWAGGYVEHHGLVLNKVVMFSPFLPNTVVKGRPRLRKIIDPHAVLTNERRRRMNAAKQEHEIRAAWRRIERHIDRDVPQAVRCIVKHAEQEPGFLEDLWKVLPPLPIEFYLGGQRRT